MRVAQGFIGSVAMCVVVQFFLQYWDTPKLLLHAVLFILIYIFSIYAKICNNLRSFRDLGESCIKGNYVVVHFLSVGMFLSCSLGYSTYLRSTYLTTTEEIRHIKQDFYDIMFSGYYRSHN